MAKSKKSELQLQIEKANARAESRTAPAKAPGGGSLPDGVTGIAKLTRVDFDAIKEGEYKGKHRLYVHGVVVAPKSHNGIPIEGKLVQPSMIKLCETKGRDGKKESFAANIAKAENRLKLLGFPTEDFDDLPEETVEYFNENGESMFFSFRTWKPEKRKTDKEEPRVQIIVEGAVEFSPPDDDDIEEVESVEEDEEEEVEEAEEDEEEEEPAPKKKAGKVTKKPASKPAPKAKKEKSLDELAELADEGDEVAQTKIGAAAAKVGIDSADYETWAEVVAAMSGDQEDEDDEPQEEDDEEVEETEEDDDDSDDGDDDEETDIVPTVGSIWAYKPPRSRVAHDCEVMQVFPKKESCNLKSLTNDKIFKMVGWEDLSESESSADDE